MTLAEVHLAMEALAAETRAVEGCAFCLVVHRRRTGQLSLRWRMVGGRWQHTQWGSVEMMARLGFLSAAWQQWYAEKNQQAVVLNAQVKLLRATHRVKASSRMAKP